MADVFYIWLFAMAGATAFVIVIALAHAMNCGIATNRSIVTDRCRKLVACCSTAISIAVFFAGSLIAPFVEPGAARAAHSVAYRLSMLLDQSKGKGFASFLRQTASQNFRFGEVRDTANVKKGLETRTIAAAVIPPLASDPPSSVSTTSSTPSAKSPSKEGSRSDVVWLFDQKGGPSLFALSREERGATVTGFLLDGENTSDRSLTDVQAVLIPDRNAGNLELTLGLSEHSTDEVVRTIPPRARFSLANTFSNYLKGSSDTFVEKSGGVIFMFHYTDAGVRKGVIWYLSPSRLRTELRKAGALASLD